MFHLTKVFAFAVLAATTVVNAAPAKRQSFYDTVATCHFGLTPDVAVSLSTRDLEFEAWWVISQSFINVVQNGYNTPVGSLAPTVVDNGNNTFDADMSIGAIGYTATHNVAFATSLVGTTHAGYR